MYLDYYGLEKEAFHISPDPEFLFLSPSHKEALAVILYGIEKRTGFMLITGGVGLGKTTILRSALERLDKARIRVILLFNPIVSYDNLVKTIFRELEMELPPSKDPFEVEEALHLGLIEEYKNGRTVVLIIDEAQNLPAETLERLRMLSNLETDKEKLIQIILIGQEPELDNMLDSVQLRQIKQRIAVRANIVPLTEKGGREYILHRLKRAGCGRDIPFKDSALRAIIKHAKGIPRTINIVCDNALITGYGYRKRKITRKIVKEVIRDLQGFARRPLWKWLAFPVAALACLAALLAYYPPLRSMLPNALSLFRDSTRVTPAPPSQPAPSPEDPKTIPQDQKTAKPHAAVSSEGPPARSPSTPPAPVKAAENSGVEPPAAGLGASERRPLPAVSETPPPKTPRKGQSELESKSEEAVVKSTPSPEGPDPSLVPDRTTPAQSSHAPRTEVSPPTAPPSKPEEPPRAAVPAREPSSSPKPSPGQPPEPRRTMAPDSASPRQDRPSTQDQADLIDWVIDHRAKSKRGSN